jgi:RNA polymerase sigma-70 factor, ECF subfamily
MDRVDFGSVYDKYSRDVLRFAIFLAGNRADAEEIAQETFVRAWIGSGAIRSGTVKAYLFTIARNLHLDRLRDRVRRVDLPADPMDPAPGPTTR